MTTTAGMGPAVAAPATDDGGTVRPAVESPSPAQSLATPDDDSGSNDTTDSGPRTKADPNMTSAASQRVETAKTEGRSTVTLRFNAKPGRADRVADLLRREDGEIDARYENRIVAELPTAAVDALKDSPAINYVQLPETPEPTGGTGNITSEGIYNVTAERAHDKGYRGDNVTIAVIGIEFNASNPEIESNVVDTKDMTSGQTFSNFSGTHGTAVAEIVADTAPNASLVLVDIDTVTEWLNAYDYAERQGADVTVASLGISTGPFDGTGPLGDEIGEARTNGTISFISAGNAGGGKHLNLTWNDPDADDSLNFDGSDERLGISTRASGIRIDVSWNDYPNSSNDYDVYLYASDGSTLDSSTNFQDGSQDPEETVSTSQLSQCPCTLEIRRWNANGTAEFDIFANDGTTLEYNTSHRSVTRPATDEAPVSVGAVDFHDLSLEPYSSRGPTIDGRRKPEVVAPAQVSTSVYGDEGFFGTSAAAPHAAGVAALILDKNGSLTPDQQEALLTANARNITTGEPNNNSGYGLLDANGTLVEMGVNRTITGCRVIDTAGVYTVAQDIVNNSSQDCLVVKAADVTIRGQGHAVSGQSLSSEGYGLRVDDPSSGTDNVTVRNLTVDGFTVGAYLYGQTRFRNVTVKDAYYQGVVLRGANRSMLVDITIRDQVNYWGVQLFGTSDVLFHNATVVGNPSGALYSTDNSHNITAHRFTVGTNRTLNFTARDVVLRNASVPAAPNGTEQVTPGFEANSTTSGAYLNVTTRYPDAAVTSVNESTVRFYRHNGTGWTSVPGSTVDTATNTVYANVSTFSDFATFGEPGDVNLSGRILESDGTNAANDTVAVNGLNGTFKIPRTASDGTFSTVVPAYDTYGLTYFQRNAQNNFTVDDGSTDLWFVTETVVDSDTDVGTLTAPVGHDVNVTVVDESGDPVENARVNIEPEAYQHNDSVTSGLVINTTANGLIDPNQNDPPGIELNGSVTIVVERPRNDSRFVNQSYERNLTVTSARNLTVTLQSSGVTERWSFQTGGRLQYSGAAVGTKLVYVGGLDDTVYAVYRSNGTIAWRFNRSGSLADSSPLLAGGTIYVGSGGGDVYALDATTGAVQWTYGTDSAVVSSPALLNGTLFVGSNDGTVLALNETTGTEVWTFEAGGAVLSTVEADNGSVYVVTDGGALVALDAASGSQQWTVDVGTELGHSSPVAENGTVYVAGDVVYAVDATTGTVTWKTEYGGTAGGSPAVSNGTVYVAARNGTVTALDAATGSALWRFRTGSTVGSTPAVVGDRVVFGADDGVLYIVNASTGSPTDNVTLEGAIRASPTVAGDDVFVGDRNGTVTAVDNVGATSTTTTVSTQNSTDGTGLTTDSSQDTSDGDSTTDDAQEGADGTTDGTTDSTRQTTDSTRQTTDSTTDDDGPADTTGHTTATPTRAISTAVDRTTNERAERATRSSRTAATTDRDEGATARPSATPPSSGPTLTTPGTASGSTPHDATTPGFTLVFGVVALLVGAALTARRRTRS